MEAGVLYEKAQSWDKAAAVYIKLKNWSGITFVMMNCMTICHVRFVISIENICY